MTFDCEADQAAELVIERMKACEDALWSGVAFVNTDDGEIDVRRWDRYATSIQIEDKHPGINKIGIWDYDPVCGTVKSDDAMFPLYGRDPRDYDRVIDAWNESLHPDDRNLVKQAIRDALSSVTNFDSEFPVIHPDGSIRHIGVKAKLFQDSSGNPVRMFGTSSDITDRQKTAIELDETRSLRDAIQDAAGVSIIATDSEGTIITYNQAAERKLGYRRENVSGKCQLGVFMTLRKWLLAPRS